MKLSYFAAGTAAFVAVAAVSPNLWAAEQKPNAMRFFEGRTESLATVKIVMRKPFKSRSIGRGEIKSDGSLLLVQRVEDEGKPVHERRWHIREVEPGKFTGTMTEAKGPVTVDEVGGKYRFRFKMKGNLSVEQWLIPHPDWRSADNKLTVRRFGIKVGSSDGIIRKLG